MIQIFVPTHHQEMIGNRNECSFGIHTIAMVVSRMMNVVIMPMMIIVPNFILLEHVAVLTYRCLPVLWAEFVSPVNPVRTDENLDQKAFVQQQLLLVISPMSKLLVFCTRR